MYLFFYCCTSSEYPFILLPLGLSVGAYKFYLAVEVQIIIKNVTLQICRVIL